MGNKALNRVEDMKIERTVAALRKNRFDAHFIADKSALFEKLNEYLHKGASCTIGGSVTLDELGVTDYLKQGDFNYYDRYAKDADVNEIFRKAFSCDVYLTSSNAVTEDGKLYNMDGRGNRVSAMIFGSKKVVVIVGANKIVADIEEAKKRNKKISAPANGIRLEKTLPCTKTGICADCKSPQRMCCFEVVFDYQSTENRIAVLILPEKLGY